MTSMAIIGAAGRMGTTLVRCSRQFDDMAIVAAVEEPGHSALGRDPGAQAGVDEIGVELTDDTASLSHADVVVNFTVHTAVPQNAGIAAHLARPMIIGTTGLDDAESASVREAAKNIPIVWAPNMSLGVNILFSAVKRAATVLGLEYRVCIEETHHIHKKDAPSGTALRLGQKVAEGRVQDFNSVMVHNPGRPENDFGPGTIVIHSHRKGEVVGDHTVSFENEGERIEFTHHAWSREAFAMGALRAARWVKDQPPGLYDMKDVLEL